MHYHPGKFCHKFSSSMFTCTSVRIQNLRQLVPKYPPLDSKYNHRTLHRLFCNTSQHRLPHFAPTICQHYFGISIDSETWICKTDLCSELGTFKGNLLCYLVKKLLVTVTSALSLTAGCQWPTTWHQSVAQHTITCGRLDPHCSPCHVTLQRH